MKKNNLLILLLLGLFVPNLYSQNIKNIKNYPFVNPTPGEISIMAVSPFPDGVDPTFAAYQDIVNCGFNLVTSQGSANYFKNQFNLIGNLNLKYIISSPNLRDNKMQGFVAELKGNKHLGGWLFKDEPRYAELEELKTKYTELAKASPSSFIYMNLVGGIGKPFTGDITSYYDYLVKIDRLFAPQIWSCDFYPIRSKNKKITVDYDTFYDNLEGLSRISKETERPFWSFCLGMAFKASWADCPAPTVPFLSFEAFNALAYGAQGIVYWTYALRKSTDSEIYSTALVDLKGKKTPCWYYAQQVNREIKKFNNVFYGCDVKAVRHTGDKLYKNTQRLSGNFGPFKMIRSGSAGVLVSLIENQGKTYIVAVNHDVVNKQKVTFELQPNNSVTQLTGKIPKNYNWKKDINITLDKGGWVIFQLN